MWHYVLAGTLTKDVIPNGYTIGGTVFYSGVQVQRLGVQVSAIATAQPDLDLTLLEGIQTYLQPSAETTTFKNIYDEQGNRVQYLSAQSEQLRPDLAPPLKPDVLHLCPLAGEVPLDYAKTYPHARLAVTPQGWMRRFERDGRVYPRRWEEADYLLPQAWAMVFSEEDVGYDEAEITRLGNLCPITVCTRNFSAASLFVEGQRSEVPTRAAQVVDPTGAGDVFAAAFFVWLYETNDPLAAVRFAHIAAAQSIEGKGVSRVLNRADLLRLFQA